MQADSSRGSRGGASCSEERSAGGAASWASRWIPACTSGAAARAAAWRPPPAAFPAKPSARDWVSRRDFSENRKRTGLLAVLHPIFRKSAAGDPESCRYDVKGWERLPSPSRPRFVLVRQGEAIIRLGVRKVYFSNGQRDDRQAASLERPCRSRFAPTQPSSDPSSRVLLRATG